MRLEHASCQLGSIDFCCTAHFFEHCLNIFAFRIQSLLSHKAFFRLIVKRVLIMVYGSSAWIWSRKSRSETVWTSVRKTAPCFVWGATLRSASTRLIPLITISFAFQYCRKNRVQILSRIFLFLVCLRNLREASDWNLCLFVNHSSRHSPFVIFINFVVSFLIHFGQFYWRNMFLWLWTPIWVFRLLSRVFCKQLIHRGTFEFLILLRLIFW